MAEKSKTVDFDAGFRLPNGFSKVVVYKENRGGGFELLSGNYHIDDKVLFFKYPGKYKVTVISEPIYELNVEKREE